MCEDDRDRSRRERSHRFAEMMAGGRTHRQIGVEPGISGPDITQWIARDLELRRLPACKRRPPSVANCAHSRVS